MTKIMTSITISPETMKKIEDIKNKEKRSRNFVINQLIEKALEKGKKLVERR